MLVVSFASSKRNAFVFSAMIVLLALYFAAFQLGALILIGFFMSKLYSYRMVNAFLTRWFRF